MSTIYVGFPCESDDLVWVATHLLLAIIEEEDWWEDEQPAETELAKKITKVWLDNELRNQLRMYGQSYVLKVEQRLNRKRHADRKRHIAKAVAAQVAELYPEKSLGKPLIEVLFPS